MIVEATLVKRYVEQTCDDCGMPLMELKDDIPLGKVYRVKLESRGVKALLNKQHSVMWQCEMVEDADLPHQWLPTQMLMRNGMAL